MRDAYAVRGSLWVPYYGPSPQGRGSDGGHRSCDRVLLGFLIVCLKVSGVQHKVASKASLYFPTTDLGEIYLPRTKARKADGLDATRNAGRPGKADGRPETPTRGSWWRWWLWVRNFEGGVQAQSLDGPEPRIGEGALRGRMERQDDAVLLFDDVRQYRLADRSNA